MPLIRRFFDPNTGASFGTACWVVGEVQLDTERDGVRVNIATYVGLPEYSAGRQPIQQIQRDLTGTPYMVNFDVPIRSMAQAYIASLPEFSGSIVV